MSERLKLLYQRYLDDDCTPEELDELRDMMALPEHQQQLEALMDHTWEEVKEGVQRDLTEEKARGIFSDIVRQKKRRPVARLWLQAAASVAILLFAGYYILQRTGQNPWQQGSTEQILANDVAPGSDKGKLLLGDGSVIDLENVKEGQIWKDPTVEVIKKKGELVFVANKNASTDTTWNVITTPNAGKYMVVLPDQTRVWLNANSSLRFPSAFSGRERKVTLTGECYFEVAKNRHAPFKVHVRNTVVEVLGTHFNVMAYENEPSVNTTLLEGSVRVSNGRQSRVIVPGQQVASTEESLQLSTADTEEVIAWKNGLFQFNSTDLASIMHQLERWYDVKVIYRNNLAGKRYTGLISRQTNLSQVLKMLELAGGIHFTIEGKTVIVSS
ncbi:FecR family protein [Chitinophaga cymbidii]|uniref:Iron dicitrate transporter FecR n=1 Tax=Chitinophaga cymbidii TaxID=1096750 RepID=A0A512RSV3_9BACT|nr:FecR domain-containing protein [Chitinophaga cymbidii]GEP98786.1 iron dicitrate transporter FecR [Chitinophaga cymbidii]